ncbi:MAG: DUF3551 domain-containing protein [Proteobacteria bacterium]|nr:DUF3551 domain-containing protein [Pseudomonadota bacterium]
MADIATRTTGSVTTRPVVLIASFIGAVVAFGVVAPSAAVARDYPYCIKGDYYMSAIGDCSFDTYQQCLATASGRLAYCDVNPFYRPAEGDRTVYPDGRRGRYRR